MKIILNILLCTTLLIPCNESQQKNIIPLKVERDRTLVTIKLGDLTIPDILLDTGYPADGLLIYNPDYHDSLDLSNAIEIRIPGAGSGNASNALMLDSANFSLGDIQMINQRMIMLTSDTYKGFPSNGIIGYSIFGHYATEFNYDEGVMILHDFDSLSIDDSWAEIPIYFKIKNKIPWIDAAIVIDKEDPIPISTYIDYAAGEAILLLEKPDMKFNLPEETVEVHLGRGLSGDIYGKTGQIAKLIIGPYELNDVKASFAEAKVRSKQDNADGIIGNGALRKFNLIFDYRDKKLYLKPNRHFDDPYH